MNVIDVGCSFIKSYVLEDIDVVDHIRLPTKPDFVIQDTLSAFHRCGLENSQSTIVISTSDSVVVEYTRGEPHNIAKWTEHASPPVWMDSEFDDCNDQLTPYEKSGHPRYDFLRGAANQMLFFKREIGLHNIRRILPLSTYIATKIAGNHDWNTWDYTHATNSGFYDFSKGRWADEAEPFIEAGVINEKIVSSNTRIPASNNFRQVYIGGHDSVFANATDVPYSTKPYVSCGTWTTISVQTDHTEFPKGKYRYVAAPNGATLKQICFPSVPEDVKKTVETIIKFYGQHYIEDTQIPRIKLFGAWSEELADYLLHADTNLQFAWYSPDQQHGCLYLPRKAATYAKKTPGHEEFRPYFCQGA